MKHLGRGEHGVVLLEALIAILVFSIGILGFVALQTVSVKNITEAQFRSEAAIWSDTLLALMRVADPATRSTNFATGGTGYVAWKNRLTSTSGNGLPGATSTPPQVSFSGNQVTITIYWRSLTDTTTHQYVTVAQLD